MAISVEEKLLRLKTYASDLDREVRSAHSEACRLAEVAGEAQKYAQASMDDASNALEQVGRLSDREEAAVEAVEAYKEAMAAGTATWDKPPTHPPLS